MKLLILLAVGYANVGLSFSRVPAEVFASARIGIISNRAHINRLLQANPVYDHLYSMLRDGHGIALLEHVAGYNTESDGDQIQLLVAVVLEHDEMERISFVKGNSNLPVGMNLILFKKGGKTGWVAIGWFFVSEFIWPLAEPYVKGLIDYIFFPNDPKCSQMPLICAAEEGDEAMVRDLLEHDAYPNVQDSEGMTPLIYATKRGDKGMVRLLFEYGADPNILDNNGASALGYAVEQGDQKILKILLDHGADPNYGVENRLLSHVIEEGSTAINRQYVSMTTIP